MHAGPTGCVLRHREASVAFKLKIGGTPCEVDVEGGNPPFCGCCAMSFLVRASNPEGVTARSDDDPNPTGEI